MGACVVMEHQQNDASTSDMLRSPEELSHDDVVRNEQVAILRVRFSDFLSQAFKFD